MTADSGYADAVDLYRSGQYYTCLETCERILSGRPDHAPVLHLIGLLCFKAGDIDAAGAYFAKAVSADPNLAEPYPDLALVLKKQGRIEEAIRSYHKGLELDPANAQAHYNYGVALRMAGRDRDAARAFQEAVTLNPLIADGFVALGQTQAALGEHHGALDSFRRAIAADPANAAAYRSMAGAARRVGQGHIAVDALRLGVSILDSTEIRRELAELLEEQGRPEEALTLLRETTGTVPGDADGWEALAEMCFRLHRFDELLDALKRCLAIDPSRAALHLRLYAVAQILGNRELALEHQKRALAINRIFTEAGPDPHRPHLLLLKAPGDWQANLPTDFIIRRQDWGALHHYFVEPDGSGPADLPPVQAVFNAVAEPDRTRPELRTAQGIIDRLGLPSFNQPAQVAGTGRADIAHLLADLPGCIVPATFRIDRNGACRRLTELLGRGSLTLPFLLRPTGTHAGAGLTLVEDPAIFPSLIDGVAADEFYATQYVDYQGPDGLFRKYRVIVVDGRPYPFHMGLSKKWMVHYYNSEPGDQSRMDSDEERFLATFAESFPKTARDAFAVMHQRLGLDFFGVDCGLAADGRLILFEVDVGVIVHLMDDPIRYAYKHRHVPAIFHAVRAMIE